MAKKTWEEKLNQTEGLPLVQVSKKDMMGIKTGESFVIAPPLEFQAVIEKIPEGEVKSTAEIREIIAKSHKADKTCPLTAGLFINIVAGASEHMGTDVPWWRVVKNKGELNPKFPDGQERQAAMLEAEGHEIDRSRKIWRVKGSAS